MNFVTHLQCANCGQHYPAGQLHGLCSACQRPLWVCYHLEALKTKFPKKALFGRPPTIWRYLELLPIIRPDKIVSLTETITPILETRRVAAKLGLEHLYLKDESRLPSGSFKARGMAMAISMANEFGLKDLAVPTAGNAGGALAVYAARAGMKAHIFMPADSPVINRKECFLAGAEVFAVDGLISECARLVADGQKQKRWFDVSTLKEPYRIEGKKTMGLELAEQFDWDLPDVVLYPTGGGTGLIGMVKAFRELGRLGWLSSLKLPKMIACQSDGCAPIVRAFEKGERFAKRFEGAATIASGIRVPAAIGDFMILDAIRESGGMAIATPEGDIPKWMRLVCSEEGIAICPETAVCYSALEPLLKGGAVRQQDRIVIFNTAAAQKYPEAIQENTPSNKPN